MALEYVEGQSCTQWAAECRHNQRAILDVFLRICGAVQFAHSRLVVHRDLKPSNILISADWQPHILDFGVARLLEPFGPERTKTGYRAFTLHYASPGQILGQPASTTDDIYALGVLLFELLVGDVPYRLSALPLPDLIRFAQGEDCVPRQPCPGVDEDLRAVIAKALARDSEVAYRSVEALAEDLQRYLHGFPVQARGPGLLYRCRKFIWRQRLLLAGGTAALVLAAAAGLKITREAEQARLAAAEAEKQRNLSEAALRREAEAVRQVSQKAEEAARSRAAAVERFNDVRSLAGALLDTLEPEASKLPGAGKFRQLLTQQAALYLDKLGKNLRGEPEDAEVWDEIARAWHKVALVKGDLSNNYNLGDPQGSLEAYRNALHAQQQRARLLPGDWEALRRVEDARITYAAHLRMMQRTKQAESLLRQADASLATLYKHAANDKILETLSRARYYTDLHSFLEITERLVARHPEDANLLRNLALGCKTLASDPKVPIEERLTFARRALQADQRRLENAPHDAMVQLEVSLSTSVLATVYARLGRHREALTAFEQVVAIRRGLVRSDPENLKFTERLAAALNLLGWHLHQSRQWDKARAAFAEARGLLPRLKGKIAAHVADELEATSELGIALQPDAEQAALCQASARSFALEQNARKVGAVMSPPLFMMLPELRARIRDCPPAR